MQDEQWETIVQRMAEETLVKEYDLTFVIMKTAIILQTIFASKYSRIP